MNLMIVTGRLVRDPVIRNSKKSGRIFCSMRFCITGDYRGTENERETEFIDMLAFGSKAQVMAAKLRKGMRLLVNGSFKIYESIDQYGQKQERFYLRVKSYEMIDSHVTQEPIEDLTDGSGNLLIPKEITDSLIRQVDAADEDLPIDYLERSIDDLLQD